MNYLIRLLMLSDIFLVTGFGLMEPILAIFIKENLIGGTIFAAGIASTIFIVTKCIVQLPFSKYIDNHDDKVKWLATGTFLICLVPLIYIFAANVYYIYFAQILYGLGAGLAYPTWLGLWSTHLDKKHESYEWSVYSTLTGVGAAVSALIGAAIANYVGFVYTFLLVDLVSLIGFFILLGLEKKEREKDGIDITHYHKRRKLINKKHH